MAGPAATETALALVDGDRIISIVGCDEPPDNLSMTLLDPKGSRRAVNPPANDRFCPEEAVTRGQIAALLVRAFGYTDDGAGDLFTDDDGSVFEQDIDRLATAGVTKGCNPPTNDRFCPTNLITREQFAAMLHRALG